MKRHSLEFHLHHELRCYMVIEKTVNVLNFESNLLKNTGNVECIEKVEHLNRYVRNSITKAYVKKEMVTDHLGEEIEDLNSLLSCWNLSKLRKNLKSMIQRSKA
ncbi:hypothetical protein AVEN_230487-1 [Araneus ventricosus]|uniref:Uncharacterized protein n=1 Tax=Araneus ventricosus TaxID=182803 RepID=A0A4Y2IE00_ARAVE|nr:hypothetical protein AVEN_230487-1 [Araneus ventricosus]